MPANSTNSPLWSRLHAWLSPSGPPASAGLIFVFAGKMDRKQYALDLLRQGLAPAALISVGRFEIRRFSKMSLPVPLDLLQIAQPVPPPQRHYFVFFANQAVEHEHVPLQRFGTLSEVRALARWLGKHSDIHSLLIISNAIHLRRIRLCCRALLNSNLRLTYLAAPPERATSSTQAPGPSSFVEDDADANTLRSSALLRELLKLLAYWFLLKFDRNAAD